MVKLSLILSLLVACRASNAKHVRDPSGPSGASTKPPPACVKSDGTVTYKNYIYNYKSSISQFWKKAEQLNARNLNAGQAALNKVVAERHLKKIDPSIVSEAKFTQSYTSDGNKIVVGRGATSAVLKADVDGAEKKIMVYGAGRDPGALPNFYIDDSLRKILRVFLSIDRKVDKSDNVLCGPEAIIKERLNQTVADHTLSQVPAQYAVYNLAGDGYAMDSNGLILEVTQEVNELSLSYLITSPASDQMDYETNLRSDLFDISLRSLGDIKL